jgi:hypothetical protein
VRPPLVLASWTDPPPESPRKRRLRRRARRHGGIADPKPTPKSSLPPQPPPIRERPAPLPGAIFNGGRGRRHWIGGEF